MRFKPGAFASVTPTHNPRIIHESALHHFQLRDGVLVLGMSPILTGIWSNVELRSILRAPRAARSSTILTAIRTSPTRPSPRTWSARASCPIPNWFARLDTTLKLSDVDLSRYDAVHVAGGRGATFDLFPSEDVARALEHFWAEEKVVGAICHGAIALEISPAAFAGAR